MRQQEEERISLKFEALAPMVDERMTRLWAAAQADALGPGGASLMTRAIGIRGKRIWMGRKDLDEVSRNPPQDPRASSVFDGLGQDVSRSRRRTRRWSRTSSR